MSERDPLLPANPRDAPAVVEASDAVVEPEQQQPARTPSLNRKKIVFWSLAGAIMLIGAALIIYFVPYVRADGPLRYPGEKLDWTVCGNVEGKNVECSRIDVPMNHFDEYATSNEKFSIPVARLRGNDNAKNLFVNPGGPGGSGVNFIFRKGKAIQEIVGQDFHILSFDPRGVNGSKPQAICFPDSEVRKAITSVQIPSDPVEAASLYNWAGNFAHSCADTTGEHGKYINTPQTAADMNSILDAIGQENMIYWGFSYGSILGQTYANMFPERSERVAVDGVVDHFNWYNGTIESEDFHDSDNVLHGFFDECVKAGDDCPLAEFGNDAKGLEKNVTNFIRKLKDDPYPVYVNNSLFGTIDYSQLWFGAFFGALYKPASWYSLADVTAQLMKGNGTAALLAFGLEGPEDLLPEHNIIIRSNDGTSGKSFWPTSRKALLKEAIPFIESQSSFAANSMEEFIIRAQWEIPHTHTFVPDRHVKTLHPVLVLSTTYDPICPLVSAKVARDIFVDSRLIEVETYGHCSLAMPSLCAARHVHAFFNNGTMPDEDVKCPADGPYYINPNKDKSVKTLSGADAETERLMAALVALSDAIEVPSRR
ncbi:hypothetical protein VHEMI03092 [[Torrubiella] hemipterigena]|uniref:Uncharacterized protein n=1 Tax=[Torrubiella] hemipterigena TaxID=1531966 RepID=A0A0A1SXK5_9HYPO|nr:hypothetical protein VHEMI03092 [[Torrubiella] hemipterigena]